MSGPLKSHFQGRAFHTLSNNIFFLQPVRAEVLLTPFQTIFLFFQPARAELTHPLKEYFIPPAKAEKLFDVAF